VNSLQTKLFVFLAFVCSSRPCAYSAHPPSTHRFFLEGTAAIYAFSTIEGNLPGSITIAWALTAITAHQMSSGFVHWTVFTFTLLWVAKATWGLLIRGCSGVWGLGTVRLKDEECAPLVEG